MNKGRLLALAVLAGLALLSPWGARITQAQSSSPGAFLVGKLLDPQGQPVEGADVILTGTGENSPLAEAQTQPNGDYSLSMPEFLPDGLSVHVERAHFEETDLSLTANQVSRLRAGETVALPETTLVRRTTPAFWFAALVFVLVVVLIAAAKLHNTLAALSGAALLLGISYLGSPLYKDLFVFDFPRSLSYVDWNVIFLVMGMMIVIAIVEHTGIFQWLAFFAYRLSRGRMWLLLPILMLITGVTSAFLDNVTTMLLMTPITVQISLALGISPLALLMPEVMASNVIGVSTLVGTPTNILIGSFGDLSFNDFLVNLTPGVLLAFVGLVIYSGLVYRKDLAEAHRASSVLLDKLEENATITDPENLRKAGWVGAGMLLMFVFGERIHLLPAVTALIGATALMVWIRPDIEAMIEAVDWTTLVFFMALFIVVGGIQEVGLIGFIASGIGNLVGNSLFLTMLTVTWVSAILSTVIANIPFTAAMLPVVGFLTATVPGAEGKVLFFCLSVGSAMGGNGSLIGASANMVTAGISGSAGYPVSYVYFLRKGIPALAITVALAFGWLVIRFL